MYGTHEAFESFESTFTSALVYSLHTTDFEVRTKSSVAIYFILCGVGGLFPSKALGLATPLITWLN